MSKKIINILLPIVTIAFVVYGVVVTNRTASSFHKNSGVIFGTVYNITYEYNEDLGQDILAVLNTVDNSLSMFNKESEISLVNQNKTDRLTPSLYEIITLAQHINRETDGAFDITVAPLVNAWGFGFKNGQMPTDAQVDSLLEFIGMEKLTIRDSIITKADPRMMLDCSAIAKGYGVDAVARMLASKGIKNYMVDIGGEVVTRGHSTTSQPWRIGVVKPTDDSLSVNNELQTTFSLTDAAIATSGNYRNFYYKDGKKYAHTIDPKTGRPVQHNVLSATVMGPDCATADAYATSFMVLGLEGAKKVLARHNELKAYIIYADDNSTPQVWSTIVSHN